LCGGAIGEAMDLLNANQLINDYEFRFVVAYTECDPAAGVGVGVGFMKNGDVDMVLGPPCPYG
uniref:ANF_receptor domain-containing protein n=1 Tax=Heligmosomoides polygyrus TaxID=6339 RepID=A0A183GVA6_HELPZ